MSDAARAMSRAELVRSAGALAGAGDDRGARVEVLAGELVEKAAPTWEHSETQATVVGLLWPRFRGGAHGCWILTEPDVSLGPEDLVRPDADGGAGRGGAGAVRARRGAVARAGFRRVRRGR